MSPEHRSLLKAFEESLAQRINNLKPSSKEDVRLLFWMARAMKELCGLHTDAKTLIESLELPIGECKDKWIEFSFDNSTKLLEIFNSFTSEIRELEQRNLHLLRALNKLGGTTGDGSCSSLDNWKQSKNPSLDRCTSVINDLSEIFDLPKVDNYGKGKVLMRAMYGVKVFTHFVCGVFAASFSGSGKTLTDHQVPDTPYVWANDFAVLQTRVNTEMKRKFSSGEVVIFTELEALDANVEELHLIVREETGLVEDEVLTSAISKVRKSLDEYSQGLLILSREVDNFFQAMLSERDAPAGK